jgi:uncharacterized protein YndB with AHSA1/START domain
MAVPERTQEEDGMGRTLMHQVEIQAPPDKVYRAVATEDGVRSFWTRDADVPSEVGGRARFGFATAPMDLELRVDELEPGSRVVWSCVGDWAYWKGTTMTWEIEPSDGGGSRLMFRHDRWPEDHPEGDFASVNFVWGQVVGRLKAYAETGQPQPFFD